MRPIIYEKLVEYALDHPEELDRRSKKFAYLADLCLCHPTPSYISFNVVTEDGGIYMVQLTNTLDDDDDDDDD